MNQETAPPSQRKGTLNSRFFVDTSPPITPFPAATPHETVNIQSTYLEEIGRIPLLSSEQERSHLKNMHADKGFHDHLAHLTQLQKTREANTKLLEAIDKREERATLLATEQELSQEIISIQAAMHKTTGGRHFRELTQANLRLVVKVATKFQGLGLDLLDLIQEGTLGLMEAILRCDPDKGKITTYAPFWIRKALHDALRVAHGIHLPQAVADDIYHLRQAETTLLQEKTEPSYDDLATATGIVRRRVETAITFGQPVVSIHTEIDEKHVLLDIIYGRTAMETVNPTSEIHAILEGKLKPNEIKSFIMRHVLGLELEDIARKLGVSRQMIQQYLTAADAKLADPEIQQQLLDAS